MIIPIRWKIVFFALVPIVGLYSVFMIISITNLKQWTTVNEERRMTEIANNYADRFDNRLREAAQLATMTALFLEQNPKTKPDQLFSQLQSNLILNPYVYSSTICFEPYAYDPNKELVMCYVYRDKDSIHRVDRISSDYLYTDSTHDYWHIPKKTGKPLWTEPYLDKGRGNIYLCTYSVPITKDSSFYGVITVEIPLHSLLDLADIDIDDDFMASVITKNYEYVYGPYYERINQSIFESLQQYKRDTLTESEREILARGTGVYKVSGWTSNEREWVFYAPIESTQWGFVASMKESIALSAVHSQFKRNILFLIISLVIILCSTIFFTFVISRPIAHLKRATAEISNGNFHIRTEHISNDELGALATSINEMAMKLDERERALKLTQFSVDRTTDAVFWIRPDARIKYANDAALKQVGYSKKELLTMTIYDIRPEFSEKMWKNHWEKLKKFGSFLFETTQYTKEGSIIPVEIAVNYLHFEGKEYNCAFVRDITHRKNNENALIESERKFRSLIETMNDGLAIQDEQGLFVYVNDRLCMMFGYEPHEMIGKQVTDFLDEKNKGVLDEQMELRKKGSTSSYEIEWKRKNGQNFATNMSPQVLYDAHNKKMGSFAIITDISMYKKVKDDILSTKEFYETILEGIVNGVWVTDQNDIIYYTNTSLGRIMSIESKSLQGSSINQELFTAKLISYYEKAKQTLKPVYYESQLILTSTQRESYQSGWFIPLVRKRQFNGMICTLEDITDQHRSEIELKKSEEKFRNLFENMSSGVAIFRADSKGENFIFEDFNRGAEIIEGIKREKVKGQRVKDIFPGVVEFGLYDVLKRVWTTGKAEHHPISFYKDNRIEGWRENYIYKLPGGEIIAIYDNITEQKQMEEAIKKQNEELETAVRQKERDMNHLMEGHIQQEKLAAIGQISGNIAHEIRNPLGAVKQSVYFLKRKMESYPLKIREHLDLIDQELVNTNRVINHMLKLTEYSIMSHCEEFNVRTVINEIVDRWDMGTRIKLTVDLVPEPFILYTDPLQFRQLMMNLFSNAIQAILEKGEIKVRGTYVSDNTLCRITIEDTGVGIKKSNMGNIFNPLFTTKENGTGLGLGICKQIVANHDGSLSIKSNEGHGTSVTLLFPVRSKQTHQIKSN